MSLTSWLWLEQLRVTVSGVDLTILPILSSMLSVVATTMY